MEQKFDVAIIGGGINGCGIAADAALRGLSVVLCEQDDLASQTSSKSTKLIHGGLRYLEYLDFALVKKALGERQRLYELAPHLVHPLPFVFPHRKNLRSMWLLRVGLFIYDYLNLKNTLPHTKYLSRKRQSIYFSALQQEYCKALLFYDCATDDARLTISNALQAQKHGAHILTRTKLLQATTKEGYWKLQFLRKNQTPIEINAKVVINATGPWVRTVNELLQVPTKQEMSLVKGSHIVVPKLYSGNHAYVLQHHDKRIVFTIPYHDKTLVGTTELVFDADPSTANIAASEVQYLLDLLHEYFQWHVQPEDIITSWSGIRPLLAADKKNPSALSRDYTFHLTIAPEFCISVYGGKISTYRHLSSEIINALEPKFPHLKPSITALTPLPGALFDTLTFNEYQTYAKNKYLWLPEEILTHYLQNYGCLTETILAHCNNITDLGLSFSSLLYQVEVDYLLRHEWAEQSEDILWRRTKLGLHIKQNEITKLDEYLRN